MARSATPGLRKRGTTRGGPERRTPSRPPFTMQYEPIFFLYAWAFQFFTRGTSTSLCPRLPPGSSDHSLMYEAERHLSDLRQASDRTRITRFGEVMWGRGALRTRAALPTWERFTGAWWTRSPLSLALSGVSLGAAVRGLATTPALGWFPGGVGCVSTKRAWSGEIGWSRGVGRITLIPGGSHGQE